MASSKKPLTARERLVASLELKIKNKETKLDKIIAEHKSLLAKENEELEILKIQYTALKK